MMSKCTTCHDVALLYYDAEVFCADCNDKCISRLKSEDIILTDAEENRLKIVFQITKSLAIRDMINKNSLLKSKKISEQYSKYKEH